MNSSALDSLHNAIAALERAAKQPTVLKALDVGVIEALEELNNVTSIACGEIRRNSKRCTPKRKRGGKIIVMPANHNPNHPEGPGAA